MTVVRDGAVLVFTHDGDDVEQVAQLVDPGLAVRDVVALGVTIGQLYERKPKRAPEPARTLPTASDASSAAQTTPKRTRAPHTPSGIVDAELFAYIDAHPGCTAHEIAAGLGLALHARKALDMRLWKWRKAERIASTIEPGHNILGTAQDIRRYHPITQTKDTPE